jgi:hypothetical protein
LPFPISFLQFPIVLVRRIKMFSTADTPVCSMLSNASDAVDNET